MNFKLIFYLITVFTISALKAQTVIPGGIVSGIWTQSGSPYLIQNAIMIPNDSILIVEPGVTIDFQGHYKFLILGTIIAEGTQNDSILFTASDTTIGWLGIRFDNTLSTNDSSKFQYCKFEYGRATSSPPDNCGGALWFDGFSKAIISNTLITRCYAGFAGAAIFCDNGSSPVIKKNIITKNKCIKGGGISCYNNSNPRIIDNEISHNIADDGSNNGAGGAIYCYNGSSPIIENNLITNNYVGMGRGGGIFNVQSSLVVSNNIINNNEANSGGGLYIGSGGLEVIENNFITNNTSNYGGGGINCSGGNYIGNVIANNTSNLNGGGIFSTVGNPYFENNTIVNNTANYGNALFCNLNSNPTFNNSIFWGAVSDKQIYLDDEGSDPTFIYCDIQLGISGIEVNTNVFYLGVYSNNIDTLPDFVNPSSGNGIGFDGIAADWSLSQFSACINAGNPSGSYPSFDITGNTRVVDTVIDIGAYETQIITDIEHIIIPNKTDLTIAPNPFQNETTITFQQPQVNSIIRIIDINGCEVSSFYFNGNKLKLSKNNMTAGIYFLFLSDKKGNVLNCKKFVIE